MGIGARLGIGVDEAALVELGTSVAVMVGILVLVENTTAVVAAAATGSSPVSAFFLVIVNS